MSSPTYLEWIDADGTRVVVHNGRLSVYGEPSMRRDDGVVAVGADVPEWVQIRASS